MKGHLKLCVGGLIMRLSEKAPEGSRQKIDHKVFAYRVFQSSTIFRAIDDRSISLKAIDERIFKHFCNKNAIEIDKNLFYR